MEALLEMLSAIKTARNKGVELLMKPLGGGNFIKITMRL